MGGAQRAVGVTRVARAASRRRAPEEVDRSFARCRGALPHYADPAALASWAGATASWPNRTDPGGTRGLDDYFTRDFTNNIGAEIMGRGKFGPQKGPWEDLEWQGWWGDTPLVDTMHVVVVPVELGRGGKLWDSPDELLDRFHHERIPSPSGVTHHLFWRR